MISKDIFRFNLIWIYLFTFCITYSFALTFLRIVCQVCSISRIPTGFVVIDAIQNVVGCSLMVRVYSIYLGFRYEIGFFIFQALNQRKIYDRLAGYALITLKYVSCNCLCYSSNYWMKSSFELILSTSLTFAPQRYVLCHHSCRFKIKVPYPVICFIDHQVY